MPFEIQVQNEQFDLIKKGAKTVELRINNDTYKKIIIGDKISFINATNNDSLEATVDNVMEGNSFNDAIQKLNPSLIQDELVSEMVQTLSDIYPKEDQERFGVVAIEFSVTTSKIYEQLQKMNALASQIKPWENEMPTEIINLKSRIWVIGYNLFDWQKDFERPFKTKYYNRYITIDRESISEALVLLFEVKKDNNGQHHFYYNPQIKGEKSGKSASFTTVLYIEAEKIYNKKKGGNIIPPPIEEIYSDPSNPSLPESLLNVGEILNYIEKSFAMFESKAKKYIAFRALFTYYVLKEYRWNEKKYILDTVKENEDFFKKNMDIDYNSFRQFRETWRNEELNNRKIATPRTNRPAMVSGFVVYNIESSDTIEGFFTNSVIKDEEGDRMTKDRDKTLQKYLDERGSLYASIIKPYDDFLGKIYTNIKSLNS